MTAVERIEKIIALLQARFPQGMTVAELADACLVPVATLQKDLKTMLNSLEVQLPFYTDLDEDDEQENEELLFEPNVCWYLLPSQSRKALIHMNIGEALALAHTLEFLDTDSPEKETLRQKILAPFNFEAEGNYRLIKGNMAPLQPIAPEFFVPLEKAIMQRQKIRFRYGEKKVTAEPLGLVYYSRLRCWYLAARNQGVIKSYHLSRMEAVERTSEIFELPECFNLKTWLAPHWGMEYGEPFSVKVRFWDRSHTIEKLKKDVAHRPSCHLTQEKEGSWIMEDRIIGENEFITWLFGFGSAAELLEPAELRAKIRERVRLALSRYSD